MSKIVILNFMPAPPITAEQETEVVASIVGMMEKQYVCAYPESQVIDIPEADTFGEMMLSIPLSHAQFGQFAVVARFLPSHPWAEILHEAVDRMAGVNPPSCPSPRIAEDGDSMKAVKVEFYGWRLT